MMRQESSYEVDLLTRTSYFLCNVLPQRISSTNLSMSCFSVVIQNWKMLHRCDQVIHLHQTQISIFLLLLWFLLLQSSRTCLFRSTFVHFSHYSGDVLRKSSKKLPRFYFSCCHGVKRRNATKFEIWNMNPPLKIFHIEHVPHQKKQKHVEHPSLMPAWSWPEAVCDRLVHSLNIMWIRCGSGSPAHRDVPARSGVRPPLQSPFEPDPRNRAAVACSSTRGKNEPRFSDAHASGAAVGRFGKKYANVDVHVASFWVFSLQQQPKIIRLLVWSLWNKRPSVLWFFNAQKGPVIEKEKTQKVLKVGHVCAWRGSGESYVPAKRSTW